MAFSLLTAKNRDSELVAGKGIRRHSLQLLKLRLLHQLFPFLLLFQFTTFIIIVSLNSESHCIA